MTGKISVRQKAILKIIVGGVIYVMAFYAIVHQGMPYPVTYGVFGLLLAAAPMLPIMLGVVELIFNVPFNDTATRWDNFHGWQRGILGILILISAFMVFIGLFILAVYFDVLKS